MYELKSNFEIGVEQSECCARGTENTELAIVLHRGFVRHLLQPGLILRGISHPLKPFSHPLIIALCQNDFS